MIAVLSFSVLLYVLYRYRATTLFLERQNNILISQFATLKTGIDSLNQELTRLNKENKNLNTELKLLTKEVSRLRTIVN